MRARSLDKKDLMGKSDPYLNICRTNSDGSTTLVHKTEVIKKCLDPVWQEFAITMASLCDGDRSRPIVIECFDWDKGEKHDLIGTVSMTFSALKQDAVFPIINEKMKSKKKNYENSGELVLDRVFVETIPSFNDYIVGGTEISVMVAIDFTGSNGKPSKPTSLHYRHPTQPNEYASAIMAVCDILASYDSDNHFPVYGFGAKISGEDKTNHCFALSKDESKPEVFGVQGIISSYYAYASDIF
jgi:hypothetical protein